MTNPKLPHSTCEVTLKLLGDFWTLRIIDSLRDGPARFCELQRQLDNINPVTLTRRLKLLEESNMLRREEETIDKLSVTYSLSDLGVRALPVIRALDDFARYARKQHAT